VASYGELGVTGLAPEVLDWLVPTVKAVADEGVDARIGDAVIGTLGLGAGEALRIEPFGSTARAFELRPRHRQSGWPSKLGLWTAEGAIIGRTGAQGTWALGWARWRRLFRGARQASGQETEQEDEGEHEQSGEF
jgi:hypothetical protein